jgi:hypothetical protein
MGHLSKHLLAFRNCRSHLIRGARARTRYHAELTSNRLVAHVVLEKDGIYWGFVTYCENDHRVVQPEIYRYVEDLM